MSPTATAEETVAELPTSPILLQKRPRWRLISDPQRFCHLLPATASCPSSRRRFIVGDTYPADNVGFHWFLVARAAVRYDEGRATP